MQNRGLDNQDFKALDAFLTDVRSLVSKHQVQVDKITLNGKTIIAAELASVDLVKDNETDLKICLDAKNS